MCEEVDEDVLSLQLESSLTLNEEDVSSTERSYNEEYGDVQKNLLDSINALQTPVKPFKSCDGDLRKKVLIRNLKTPTKDGESVDKSVPHTKVEDKHVVKEDIACFDKTDPVKVETSNIDGNNSITKEDVNILEVLDKGYIIIDEIFENSTPEKVGEKFENNVTKIKEKVEKKSGLDVDYVSKDPLENADNNNPDWQLLQKLKTDEERYKAVRERWRNLIVPEPNKDLTCFAWCRTKLANQKIANKSTRDDQREFEPEEEYLYKGRKRTFSSSGVDSPMRRGREREKSEKRVRTLSCARVYDEKIAALRRHVSDECLKINSEQQIALDELHRQYVLEKRSLSNWSLTTGHSISGMLDKLDQYHYEKRKNIQRSYEDLSYSAWEKQASQIRKLEEASAEVLAFHRFYQGLDENAPEAMALTEEQAEELEEINCMYEAFLKFYEE